MDSDEILQEDRSLKITAVVYYAILFAAMVIGLYGFLSLFWLASTQLAQSNQIFG